MESIADIARCGAHGILVASGGLGSPQFGKDSAAWIRNLMI